MEVIATVLAILGLAAAAISRIIETSREERKRERIWNRTNERPWNRSDSKHK